MSSTPVSAVDLLPFRDPALPLRKRVDDLLARLTPDERLAMLHQYVPAVPRLGLAPFRTGTEALHGVAWLGEATVFPQAVGLGAGWDEELLREVAEAVSTELRAFHHRRAALVAPDRGPISLQAWAPVVNLLRDPRWGRNEEGYAEDPLLTARLGEAFCRGLAGDHPGHLRTAPVLKHFLAYNNEDDRCTTSSGVRPRVLHEYDLAAFRPIVASGAATGAMAAYNLVNGRPCHVSPLIEAELRRWAEPTGHELFVVSDAEAPSNLVDPERWSDDHAEAHAAALKAGIDSFTDHGEDSATPLGRLREALHRGLIDQADVDRAVRRQLEVRFRLGEFDPESGPWADTPWEVVGCTEHRALALRAATESTVLLKNDGLLPLVPRPGTTVAVIGPFADTLREDWYSGTLPYAVTAADGLREAVGARGGEVVCVEGVDRITLRARSNGTLLGGTAFDVFDWGHGVLTLRAADSGLHLTRRPEDGLLVADAPKPRGWDVHETFRLEPAPEGDGTILLRNVFSGRYAAHDPADGRLVATAAKPADAERWRGEVLRDGTAEAVAAASAADVAIVVLGNDPVINGRETEDRRDLTLPPAQEALLHAVAAARPQTALVLMSSYPYAVDEADARLPAVLWTSHAGQEAGRALAAVLLGDADPGGRLPQTWYRADDPLPAPLDYDIITAGWTYQYHRAAPLYPFGHGLSYAAFAHDELRLSADRMEQDGTIEVTVGVTNTGERAGVQVVQLYVRALDARYDAPRRRLADFHKLRLEPGERRELTFRLPAERFAHWDVATGAFTVDPGAYEVQLGRSAEDLVHAAALTVTGPSPAPCAVVGRRTAAADFDGHTGLVLVEATRTEGDAVTPAAGQASALYRAVELTGAERFEAEVSRTGPADGARLEVHAGERLLVTLDVPVTGGRHTWTTVSAALPADLHGVHDLRVTLHGEVRLAAFRFLSDPVGTA